MGHKYVLNYFLTPCSIVLLEKLTGSRLVKKCPAFYVTRNFITTFTSARCQLSLSSARSIQSIPPGPFLKIHVDINIKSKPWSSKWSLSVRFPHQSPICTSPLPIRATCPAHPVLLDFVTRIIFGE